MKKVSIFMLSNETAQGNSMASGQIYLVDEHIANNLVDKGSAKKVDYPALNKIDDDINKLVADLKTKIEQINQNGRLSDVGKKEEIDGYVLAAKAEIDSLGEQYFSTLNSLKQKAQQDATLKTETTNAQNAKIDENVGLILSEVAMSGSFKTAMDYLQEQLSFIDKSTAVRLLSKFTTVRQELNSKSGNVSGADMQIKRLYDQMKDEVKDEKQRSAEDEFRLLTKLEENRKHDGHYPMEWTMLKRANNFK